MSSRIERRRREKLPLIRGSVFLRIGARIRHWRVRVYEVSPEKDLSILYRGGDLSTLNVEKRRLDINHAHALWRVFIKRSRAFVSGNSRFVSFIISRGLEKCLSFMGLFGPNICNWLYRDLANGSKTGVGSVPAAKRYFEVSLSLPKKGFEGFHVCSLLVNFSSSVFFFPTQRWSSSGFWLLILLNISCYLQF